MKEGILNHFLAGFLFLLTGFLALGALALGAFLGALLAGDALAGEAAFLGLTTLFLGDLATFLAALGLAAFLEADLLAFLAILILYSGSKRNGLIIREKMIVNFDWFNPGSF